MTSDFESRLGKLEARIERLEYREGLFLRLVDSRKRPLAFFTLEYDLNEEQMAGLRKVMENAHNTLSGESPIKLMDFEEQLLPFVPDKYKPNNSAYDFEKAMLMSFAAGGNYTDLYEHLKKDGLNLPPMEWLNS